MTSSPRYLIISLLSFFAVFAAVIIQVHFNLNPCAVCVAARYCLLLTGIFFALFYLSNYLTRHLIKYRITNFGNIHQANTNEVNPSANSAPSKLASPSSAYSQSSQPSYHDSSPCRLRFIKFLMNFAIKLIYMAGILSLLTGFAFSLRHIYIVHQQIDSCRIDPVQTFLNNIPLAEKFPLVFQATGSCLDSNFYFLGIPFTILTLGIYLILIAVLILPPILKKMLSHPQASSI